MLLGFGVCVCGSFNSFLFGGKQVHPYSHPTSSSRNIQQIILVTDIHTPSWSSTAGQCLYMWPWHDVERPTNSSQLGWYAPRMLGNVIAKSQSCNRTLLKQRRGQIECLLASLLPARHVEPTCFTRGKGKLISIHPN